MSLARQVGISFRAGSLTLEGVLGYPEGLSSSMPGVLLCHPEPHLGGTMESPVIQSLARGLTGRGYLTLRFNYRGVGQSEGKYSLGVGELEDARAALKTLLAWPGVARDRVAVVGYSFGAGIAVRLALRQKSVRAAVAVSPPLTLPPLGLQGAKGLAAYASPLLVLIGERDGLTPPAQLRGWIEELGNPCIRFFLVPEADRAWQGRGLALTGRVAEFLEKSLERR